MTLSRCALHLPAGRRRQLAKDFLAGKFWFWFTRPFSSFAFICIAIDSTKDAKIHSFHSFTWSLSLLLVNLSSLLFLINLIRLIVSLIINLLSLFVINYYYLCIFIIIIIIINYQFTIIICNSILLFMNFYYFDWLVNWNGYWLMNMMFWLMGLW